MSNKLKILQNSKVRMCSIVDDDIYFYILYILILGKMKDIPNIRGIRCTIHIHSKAWSMLH